MAALVNTRAKCLLFSLSRAGRNVHRLYAEKSENAKKQYTKSILLPKTKFPAWIKSENREETDRYLIEKCGFAELYSWQRENLQGPDFILHDGPPYANGVPHMGHAINKILKDITIRSRVIRGQRIQYVPGWDCHGLPIELKALTSLEKSQSNLKPLEIRRLARKYAAEAIKKQREVFSSWGVMADWKETGCYFTNDVSYVKNQLRRFYEMYEKKLVYRDFKPVYWSPASRTALAESELEYNLKHISKCVTARFRITDLAEALKEFEGRKVYGLAWTTTPWTLVANQALAYSNEITYSLAEDALKNIYIIAKDLMESMEQKIGPLKQLIEIKGSQFAGMKYSHPITEERLPFLPANHVTTTMGTGLVHTAPAHGSDDFLVALENKISVKSLVNKEGRYTSEAGEDFAGREVLSEGTEAIINCMGRNIMHIENIEHRYPYDWRTKTPVITVASYQWFIDTSSLKEKAIEGLKNVEVYPETNRTSSENALYQQVKKRPFWCISRQRAWGTPIPVLYNKNTGDVVTSGDFVERLCHLIDQNGSDCWWTMSVEELVGTKLLRETNLQATDLEKGQDIMDIWLDSGLSWSTVLPEGKADIYMEGVDQFTGWFQSSLLTSIALQGTAPYKALFVHGFAVDEKDEKMSKSLGNVVNPEDITRGGTSKKKNPAFGVDTLRWWVASHGCQHLQIPVGETLLKSSAESVQRIRLVLRFLLGAIHPHEPYQNVQRTYFHLDKYMLHRLYHYNNEVKKFYDIYQYHHVAKTILNFIANDVSADYCHLVKDRLYCDEVTSPLRIGAVDVVGEILTVLVRSLAPIMPHLAEESWLYHPDNLTSVPLHHSVHILPDTWNNPEVEKIVSSALKTRTELNKLTKSNTWEYNATVRIGGQLFSDLSVLQPDELSSTSELCEILQVSSIRLIKDESCDNVHIELEPIKSKLCQRCRRYPETEPDSTCERCSQIIDYLKSK